VANNYGLKINVNKSKIIQIKGNLEINKIADMEIVKEIQYMGVTVGGRGRRIFQQDKKKWLKKTPKRGCYTI